ncbi:MFS transporter [Chloroflexota bacterium]
MRHLPNLSDHPERLLKAFYFLFFAAAASLLPFLVLFYEQLGLTGRQIGVLAAIPPLITMFAASFWGGLADATQQHHRLLGLAIISAMVATLALRFSTTFWGLIVVVALFAFLAAPIIPLVDNSALECLGKRKNQYGKLRLWGAVGWGVAAPVIGWLVEQFGLGWSFYGYILFMFIGLFVSFRLPITHTSIGGAFWRGFRLLMGNRQWLFFLTVMFIAGLGSALVHNYLFLYMNHLGASETLMGLALTTATLSELVIFSLSDRLLDRWGTRKLLVISFLAMIARLLVYSFIQIPWLVLPAQLLHGFSFSARWVAGVAYANKIAPAGMGATAQGLFTGVSMGLATAVGAFTGGVLYESVGPFMMYRWAGIGILVMLSLLGLVGKFLLNLTPAPVES